MERLLWQYTLLNARDRANEIDKPPVLTEPTNFNTSVLSQFFCLQNINFNTNCGTQRISCFSLFHVSEITLPMQCVCVLSCVRLCVTLWNVASWLLSMWFSPGKNTRVGCHAILQGIFLTQESNPMSLISPASADGFFTTSASLEAHQLGKYS